MSGFLTITIIAILGAISPGPDFIVVAKNALGCSRKAGCYTSFGIFSGIVFHASYCILGLAIVISQSLLLFGAIRYLGAAYLIYLGIKALFDKNKISGLNSLNAQQKISHWQAYRQGLLINVLNPKCILFMLSIFTVVIKPETPLLLQTLYGLTLAGITALWFCLLSFMLTHEKVYQKLIKAQQWISKVMGGCLLFFGIDLLLLRHH